MLGGLSVHSILQLQISKFPIVYNYVTKMMKFDWQ